MQKRKMGFDKSHSHFMRTKYDSQGVARIPCGINVEKIPILVRLIYRYPIYLLLQTLSNMLKYNSNIRNRSLLNDGYIVISFVHTW